MTERRTRQLTAVYDAVNAARNHPTAEDIHRRVRRRLPRVSLGTVYRNLQKLAAGGRIQVVQLADRATRYDGLVEDHDHFLCEACGVVTDLTRSRNGHPDSTALSEGGYTVRAHALTFYGLCPTCAQPRGRTRAGRRMRR